MSILSRAAGVPRGVPPVTGAPLAESIGDEPCDRCGAPARHRVHVTFQRRPGAFQLGHLMFCSHHYKMYETDLLTCGAVWNT